MEFSFLPAFEHLRKTATDLGLVTDGTGGTHIAIKKGEQLFEMVQRCRDMEKARVYERACFNQEGVVQMAQAFEQFAVGNEMCIKDLFEMLKNIGVVSPVDEERQAAVLKEILQAAARPDSAHISFAECLHLTRRYFDHIEVQELLQERSAQFLANLTDEEVEDLRKVFDKLLDEEEEQREFNYPALTKAVRLFGACLTMSHLRELDVIFRKHAVPSQMMAQMKEEKLHLLFPEFLRVTFQLYREDFAGIRTSGVEDSSHGSPPSSPKVLSPQQAADSAFSQDAKANKRLSSMRGSLMALVQ